MSVTRDTAYQTISTDGTASSQRLLVLAVIKAAKRPLLRWEIAKQAEIKETSACARLRELEQAGAIMKSGCRTNPFSDKENVTYSLAREGDGLAVDQGDLFGAAA